MQNSYYFWMHPTCNSSWDFKFSSPPPRAMQGTSRCRLLSKPTTASAVCCRLAFPQCRVTQTAVRIVICIRSQRDSKCNRPHHVTTPGHHLRDSTIKPCPRLWKQRTICQGTHVKWTVPDTVRRGSTLVTKCTKTDYGVYCRGSIPSKQILSSPFLSPTASRPDLLPI
jgi:hypothetical protein